uniref:EF hand associated type-2 domain-containing protein n=2 Tax=Brassica oleracea var. oleracea TaxID=109376 RepID=A0A0D3C8S5_BRAOL
MMSGFGLRESHGSTKLVRIVVVGETRTRKSSLIMAAVTDHNHPDPRIPPLLPYTNLPSEYCSEDVLFTLIDTSLRPEDKGDIIREVKEADATFAMDRLLDNSKLFLKLIRKVVLVTLCVSKRSDRLETLDRLSEYWLLLFRHLKVRVPIVVAGYSVIQKEHNTIDTKEITTPIRQQCREIEICIEWSAPRLSDISWLAQAVFVQAQIAAMNHIGPVYDQVTNSLKPRCVAALEHIFELNACDNDYILSDDGFNHINARCFSIPLMPSRCRALIKSVQELCPEGVKENSLTVDGFLVLITKLIMDRKLRTLWTMLRTFGYNNDIRLVDEMIPYSSFKRILDQSVELTNEAIGSLRRVYHRFNNLGPQMMESLFETAPER